MTICGITHAQPIYRFQSTPPVWVVTNQSSKRLLTPFLFQSTPPVWVVTFDTVQNILTKKFQSTPPVWVVTFNLGLTNTDIFISIHTTRVGGDSIQAVRGRKTTNFNPHHPCGWWLYPLVRLSCQIKFQSTPPVWVVTGFDVVGVCCLAYFNPHHPCGWWQWFSAYIHCWYKISIHTTRVGGDQDFRRFKWLVRNLFQSTPPVWVVTYANYRQLVCYWISIHTTRVGGDYHLFVFA